MGVLYASSLIFKAPLPGWQYYLPCPGGEAISERLCNQSQAIQPIVHRQGSSLPRSPCWVLGVWGCCWFVFIYFWDRKHKMERGRERGRQEPKWALHEQQRAQCEALTQEPWDHGMSWSRMLDQLSHPGAPAPCWVLIGEPWCCFGRKVYFLCLFLAQGKVPLSLVS